MGHIINYKVVPEDCNRNAVIGAICEEVEHEDWQEGGCYHGNLTWHEDRVYESERDAHEAIERFDNGFYDDHAVLFRDGGSVAPSKELEKLDDYRKRTLEKRDAFAREHSVANLAARYIGCRKCGSKLAREFVRGERCPLCHADLRADYITAKIAAYDAKVAEIDERIEAAKKKLASRAEVCWLVKYEYHV